MAAVAVCGAVVVAVAAAVVAVVAAETVDETCCSENSFRKVTTATGDDSNVESGGSAEDCNEAAEPLRPAAAAACSATKADTLHHLETEGVAVPGKAEDLQD